MSRGNPAAHASEVARMDDEAASENYQVTRSVGGSTQRESDWRLAPWSGALVLHRGRV